MALVTIIKTQGRDVPDNVTQIRYGRINVEDQIAYDLNEVFRSNKKDVKEFKVNNLASRITSSDPFVIIEFVPKCTHLNRAHKTSTTHAFSAICNYNAVWEIQTNNDDKKLSAYKRISELPKGEDAQVKDRNLTCLDTSYDQEREIYAAVCLTSPATVKGEGSAGHIHVYTMGRQNDDRKHKGKNLFDHQYIIKSNGFNMTEKGKIIRVGFNKGSFFDSSVQFLVYDEPFIDQEFRRVKPKDNRYFIIFGLTKENKIQMVDNKLFVVKFTDPEVVQKSGLPMLGSMIKLVSVEDFDSKMMIAAYFAGQNHKLVQTVRCDVNTNAKFVLENCELLNTNEKLEIGHLQFWQGEKGNENDRRITSYSRGDKEIKICKYDGAKGAASFQVDCAKMYSRATIVKDLAFGFFDDCRNDLKNKQLCNVIYYDQAKKNFIGIDEIKYKDKMENLKKVGQELVLNNRFKAYGSSGRVLGSNFYMSENNYLIGYNQLRSEECIIRGDLLKGGENFYVTFYKDHAQTHEFINVTGYRVKQLIYQIKAKKSFPKFKGSLTNMYHVPLGREYFNGNALEFQLTAQEDILKYAHVHYLADGVVLVDGKAQKPVSYFHGEGVHSAVLTKGKISFLRCYRVLVTGKIGVNCTVLGDKTIDNDAIIIDHFSSPNVHIAVTNKGDVFTYWPKAKKGERIKHTHASDDGQGEVKTTTFKVYENYVFMVVLDIRGHISFKKLLMYQLGDGFSSIGDPLRTKYAEKDHNPEQKESGDYCPKSAKFFLSDHPLLVVLNSCKDKDRRIIKYNLFPTERSFHNNFFIRKLELMEENLVMCPDRENYFIAALGTDKMYGIGNRTHNNIEDLGLRELKVLEIKELLCVGKTAIGIFVKAKVGKNQDIKFVGITYYTGKMRDADNRVHSYFVIEGEFEGAKASEGEGLVFYNIFVKNKPTMLKVVDLRGPKIFFKSMEREVAYETEIRVSNGNVNENFNVLVEFEKLRKQTRVSCEKKVFNIEENKKYSVEDISLWHGPVWDFRTSSGAAIVTKRIGKPEEVVSDSGEKLIQADAVSFALNKTFTLGQRSDSSYLVVSDLKEKKSVYLKISLRCHGLRMVPDLRLGHEKNVVGLTNCYHNKGNPTMTFLHVELKDEPKLDQVSVAEEWPYESTKFDITYLSKEKSPAPKPSGGLRDASSDDFLAVMVHKRNKTMMMKWFNTKTTGDKSVTFNDFYREEGSKIFAFNC